MGPEDLHTALQALPLISHPHLIAGMEHAEDAGVYRLTEDLAIVQTVDFFTPIVDDPYTFGQVAAVNALSDVYAMGGQPLTAMNIVCFPVKKMDIAILQQILLGGLSKMREAGVTLVGGHSVEDDELKYGLSVTGIVHPDKVLRNRGARAGDRLILTKPLGTGIASTAVKANMAGEALLAKSIRCMTTLNKTAAELMTATCGVHACTDITGFGFLGHACEMAAGGGVTLLLKRAAVPVIGANFSLDGTQALALLKDAGDFDWVAGRARINLALGGSWGGPLDDAILPQQFLIDYVRVYQQKPD